jgi:5'-nucleotidase
MSKPKAAITVAVSARSLFRLEELHRVFEAEGLTAYLKAVRERENEGLMPGAAFPLVRALLRLNDLTDEKIVDVIVVSSMHPDAGLSVLNAIEAHGIAAERAAFTSGSDVMPILQAFGTDLFLSHSPADARRAVEAGMAAAIMYDPPDTVQAEENDQIRIAFDGDAVLFSEESERIFKTQGKAAFFEHETALAKQPMEEGPFGKLLRTIDRIQKGFPEGRKPFRITLVTARGGRARERVLRTLRAWEVTIDETYFLNGLEKSYILRALRPQIFFDDQDRHVSLASKFVPAGLVPSTVPAFAETVIALDQRENEDLRAPNP